MTGEAWIPEDTPPRETPLPAFKLPGLKIIPPLAMANPPMISAVNIAEMIPDVVKKPKRYFFISSYLIRVE